MPCSFLYAVWTGTLPSIDGSTTVALPGKLDYSRTAIPVMYTPAMYFTCSSRSDYDLSDD